MSLYLSLPEVNQEHVDSISERLCMDGYEFMSLVYKGGKPCYFDYLTDDHIEQLESIDDDDQRWKDFGIWSPSTVYHQADIPKIARNKFIEYELWDKRVSSESLDTYNECVREIVCDIESAFVGYLIHCLEHGFYGN